jgi:hypothetical protein
MALKPGHQTRSEVASFEMSGRLSWPFLFCRIRFYTQEIVVFREDLLHKMRRACVVPPSDKETADPFQQVGPATKHSYHCNPLVHFLEEIW